MRAARALWGEGLLGQENRPCRSVRSNALPVGQQQYFAGLAHTMFQPVWLLGALRQTSCVLCTSFTTATCLLAGKLSTLL